MAARVFSTPLGVVLTLLPRARLTYVVSTPLPRMQMCDEIELTLIPRAELVYVVSILLPRRSNPRARGSLRAPTCGTCRRGTE